MADDIYVTITEEESTTVTTVGEQGLTGSTGSITDITDVDATNKENGSVLVYKTNTAKWTATRLLEEQEMNGGHY
jgi:hypothetical protein